MSPVATARANFQIELVSVNYGYTHVSIDFVFISVMNEEDSV